MALLNHDEINTRLPIHSGWVFDEDAIAKRFEFDSFLAAMDFMARSVTKIDAMNHHPEWTNVYDHVDVRLTSHDEGGVTDRDFALAQVLNEVATAE